MEKLWPRWSPVTLFHQGSFSLRLNYLLLFLNIQLGQQQRPNLSSQYGTIMQGGGQSATWDKIYYIRLLLSQNWLLIRIWIFQYSLYFRKHHPQRVYRMLTQSHRTKTWSKWPILLKVGMKMDTGFHGWIDLFLSSLCRSIGQFLYPLANTTVSSAL